MGRLSDRKGQAVAHSLIEKVYGCGIRENWMPLGKPGGGSLSVYVPAEKHWEQFWIDSDRDPRVFHRRLERVGDGDQRQMGRTARPHVL